MIFESSIFPQVEVPQRMPPKRASNAQSNSTASRSKAQAAGKAKAAPKPKPKGSKPAAKSVAVPKAAPRTAPSKVKDLKIEKKEKKVSSPPHQSFDAQAQMQLRTSLVKREAQLDLALQKAQELEACVRAERFKAEEAEKRAVAAEAYLQETRERASRAEALQLELAQAQARAAHAEAKAEVLSEVQESFQRNVPEMVRSIAETMMDYTNRRRSQKNLTGGSCFSGVKPKLEIEDHEVRPLILVFNREVPPEPIDLDATQPEDEDFPTDYDYVPGPEEVNISLKVLSEDEGGLHDPFQDPFQDDIICEGTQPAENTQASQARLLMPEKRRSLGRRFARHQMATLSTMISEHDSKACLLTTSTEELAKAILKVLEAITDKEWQSTSRANVRPSGERTSLQKTLGLVTHAHFRGIPMPTTDTYRYRRLTQMILEYARRVTGENFEATSIQLTKDLKSKPHKDANNRGPSLIFGLGDWTGGETFVQEDGGPDTYRLKEGIEGIGGKNKRLRGYKLDIHQPQRFDGNKVHCTTSFKGRRYAVVLFSLGRSYDETPGLVRTFLERLGFSLPEETFQAPVLPEFPALAQLALEGRQVEDEPNRHVPPAGRLAAAFVVPGDGEQKRRRVGGEEEAGQPEDEVEWTAEMIQELKERKSKNSRENWQTVAEKLGVSVEAAKAKWDEERL